MNANDATKNSMRKLRNGYAVWDFTDEALDYGQIDNNSRWSLLQQGLVLTLLSKGSCEAKTRSMPFTSILESTKMRYTGLHYILFDRRQVDRSPRQTLRALQETGCIIISRSNAELCKADRENVADWVCQPHHNFRIRKRKSRNLKKMKTAILNCTWPHSQANPQGNSLRLKVGLSGNGWVIVPQPPVQHHRSAQGDNCESFANNSHDSDKGGVVRLTHQKNYQHSTDDVAKCFLLHS